MLSFPLNTIASQSLPGMQRPSQVFFGADLRQEGSKESHQASKQAGTTSSGFLTQISRSLLVKGPDAVFRPEARNTARGILIPHMGPHAVVTANRHVIAQGESLGYFTRGYLMRNGIAFSPDGQKLGHADRDGNLFVALFPERPIGKIGEDGTAHFFYGRKKHNTIGIHLNPGHPLTLREQGTAALILATHLAKIKP